MSDACWRFGASTLFVMTVVGSQMVQAAWAQSVSSMGGQLSNPEATRVSDLRAMSGALPMAQVTNVDVYEPYITLADDRR